MLVVTVAYYDVENLRENVFVEKAIRSVKSMVENKSGLLQFAYADWSRIAVDTKELFISNGVNMKQVINGGGYYGSFKNASDIALSVDAIEFILNNKNVLHFILVSGDGGYISLISKIRELGKRVSVVSVDNHLSKALGNYSEDVVIISDKVEAEVETKEKYEPYQKAIWAILAGNADKDNAFIIEKILTNTTIVAKIKNDGLQVWKISKAIINMNHQKEDRYKISELFKKDLILQLENYGYETKRVLGARTIVPILSEGKAT